MPADRSPFPFSIAKETLSWSVTGVTCSEPANEITGRRPHSDNVGFGIGTLAVVVPQATSIATSVANLTPSPT
jgi:hypothetical protein